MVVFQEGPMKKWLLLPLFLCLLVAPAGATSVDIGVNDFSVQLQLANPLYADDYGTVQFRGRLLYNNKEETRLASAGLMFVGEPGNVPGLDLGIGAQLYGGRTDEGQDLLALGLGGLLTYAPPGSESVMLSHPRSDSTQNIRICVAISKSGGTGPSTKECGSVLPPVSNTHPARL
jgi:hypothetical protein